MKEYRCTRTTPYGRAYSEGAPAFKDLSARQGHYVFAQDEVDAYNQLAKKFPEDIAGKSLMKTFTVTLWKL